MLAAPSALAKPAMAGARADDCVADALLSACLVLVRESDDCEARRETLRSLLPALLERAPPRSAARMSCVGKLRETVEQLRRAGTDGMEGSNGFSRATAAHSNAGERHELAYALAARHAHLLATEASTDEGVRMLLELSRNGLCTISKVSRRCALATLLATTAATREMCDSGDGGRSLVEGVATRAADWATLAQLHDAFDCFEAHLVLPVWERFMKMHDHAAGGAPDSADPVADPRGFHWMATLWHKVLLHPSRVVRQRAVEDFTRRNWWAQGGGATPNVPPVDLVVGALWKSAGEDAMLHKRFGQAGCFQTELILDYARFFGRYTGALPGGASARWDLLMQLVRVADPRVVPRASLMLWADCVQAVAQAIAAASTRERASEGSSVRQRVELVAKLAYAARTSTARHNPAYRGALLAKLARTARALIRVGSEDGGVPFDVLTTLLAGVPDECVREGAPVLAELCEWLAAPGSGSATDETCAQGWLLGECSALARRCVTNGGGSGVLDDPDTVAQVLRFAPKECVLAAVGVWDVEGACVGDVAIGAYALVARAAAEATRVGQGCALAHALRAFLAGASGRRIACALVHDCSTRGDQVGTLRRARAAECAASLLRLQATGKRADPEGDAPDTCEMLADALLGILEQAGSIGAAETTPLDDAEEAAIMHGVSAAARALCEAQRGGSRERARSALLGLATRGDGSHASRAPDTRTARLTALGSIARLCLSVGALDGAQDHPPLPLIAVLLEACEFLSVLWDSDALPVAEAVFELVEAGAVRGSRSSDASGDVALNVESLVDATLEVLHGSKKRRSELLSALLGAVMHPNIFGLLQDDCSLAEKDASTSRERIRAALVRFVREVHVLSESSPRVRRLLVLALCSLLVAMPLVVVAHLEDVLVGLLLSGAPTLDLEADNTAVGVMLSSGSAAAALLPREVAQVQHLAAVFPRVALCTALRAVLSSEGTIQYSAGRTVLVALLRASRGENLSRALYRTAGELHRQKVRLWQAVCTLVPYMDAECEAEVCEHIFVALRASDLASVRQYIELAAVGCCTRYASVLSRLVLPMLEDYSLDNAGVASALMVAAHASLCVPDVRERDECVSRLLPRVLPWTGVHHHNCRNLAQALLHTLLKAADARADNSLLECLWRWQTEHPDVRRFMEGGVAQYFREWFNELAVTAESDTAKRQEMLEATWLPQNILARATYIEAAAVDADTFRYAWQETRASACIRCLRFTNSPPPALRTLCTTARIGALLQWRGIRRRVAAVRGVPERADRSRERVLVGRAQQQSRAPRGRRRAQGRARGGSGERRAPQPPNR